MKRFDVVAPPSDSSSRSLCLDVTVASHTSKEHLKVAYVKPLVNIAHAIQGKRAKYKDDITHDTEVFIPMCCESSGAIHESYFKLFGNIGMRVDGQAPPIANWAAPTFSSYWMQRISVVLWRETAQSLIRIAHETIKRSGRRKVPGINRDAGDIDGDQHEDQ